MPPVGVTEAAKQLGVHPSQVRRNLKSGLIPNRGLPGRPLVDVDEARYARATGLDHSKQRGQRAPLFEVRNGATVAQSLSGDTLPLDDRGGETVTYQDWRARREAAAAVKAEIELAKLRGETLDRAELEPACFELGRMLRDRMMNYIPEVSTRLVGLDVGAIIAVLTQTNEDCLRAMTDEIERKWGIPAPSGEGP
jgi:hypothetical protein